MAELLLSAGYKVYGMRRPGALESMEGLAWLGIDEQISFLPGDLSDSASLFRIVKEIMPDEIYHFGAQTHVGDSFDTPVLTVQTNVTGTVHLFEAVRHVCPKAKVYNACSSEIFGTAPPPQSERTPFQPCSPYAISKLSGYWLADTYRKAYGLHICNGIAFNHESPLRGENFVTQKVACYVAALEEQRKPLQLGNLDARRDWGSARDYVTAMHIMTAADTADDFVIATGTAHTVRELVTYAFNAIGRPLAWKGSGLLEKAYCQVTGALRVEIDRALFRPNEVHHLCGDATKLREKLGWVPSTEFEALITEMITARRVPRQNRQKKAA